MVINELKGNYLLMIVGKSGSGKTAFADELVKRYNLIPLDSFTTRPKRYENEKGHIFIDYELGHDLVNDELYKKRIMGFTVFNNHYYWSTFNQVENSDLYVVDKRGVETYLEHYKGDKKPIVVYIKTNPIKRLWYMIKRGDGLKKAISRLIHDRAMFKDMEKLSNIVLYNDSTINTLIKEFEDMLYFLNCVK